MRLFLLLIGCCLTIAALSQHEHIGKKNIRFIDYPDFPEGNSTWGDIGYNPVTDAVYIGVTNHKNKIGFYEYSVSEDLMVLKGFVNELAHLRDFQWQGKIHSKITFDENGHVYFATDGGESREEYLMNHPHGYNGGYFMKWDPEVEEMTNLGMTLPYESIKNIDIDTETGKIYAITYPQVHFIIYDPKTNTMEDLGRLGSAHVPRMTFTDKWNNCYYVDWRQRLVKYEKSTGKLVFASESLPAFEGTPGQVIITGIKSYTKDDSRNIIYLATYGAKALAFHPAKEGIGEVEDLGALYETKDMPLWKPYASNLNLGLNGNLYYVLGGHGNYVKKDTTMMMELNPETRKKREVMMFPTVELSEVTGTGVRDSAGNLYFAGRKIRQKNAETPEGLPSIDDKVSIPFMIQFNPEKELND